MILHNMWCDPADPTGQTLYAVESTTDNPVFALYKITVLNYSQAVTQTKVGTFDMPKGAAYAGSDTMFQATPDMKEVYCAWSNSNQHGGDIQVMKVADGMTTTYSVDGSKQGYPYTIVPLESGKDTVLGALNGLQMSPHSAFTQFKFSGSKAEVTDMTEGSKVFTGFQPWQIEAEPQLVHTITNSDSQSIRTFNAVDGSWTSDIYMTEILSRDDNPDQRKTGGLAVKQ